MVFDCSNLTKFFAQTFWVYSIALVMLRLFQRVWLKIRKFLNWKIISKYCVYHSYILKLPLFKTSTALFSPASKVLSRLGLTKSFFLLVLARASFSARDENAFPLLVSVGGFGLSSKKYLQNTSKIRVFSLILPSLDLISFNIILKS